MTGLRAAAIALARIDRHPVLPIERLFATERVAAGLEARRTGGAEPWPDFVARLRSGDATLLSAAALRRLVRGLWRDRSAAASAAGIVERAVAIGRRSIDRAIVEAYLLHHPVDHRAFEALRAAAALAAGRHDWRWRSAGEQWRLWDDPAAFGEALGLADDPERLLRDAGFVGPLAGGAFVSAARAGAARSAR